MQSLLSDLWSHILPVALALCATLLILSLLVKSFVTARCKNRTRTPSSISIFGFSFALPLAPILLLLALWLSPQTIATTATLLARQSPEALYLLFLAAPLALFFLWCEGSSVAKINEKTSEKTTSPTTPLEGLAQRVFGSPRPNSLAYKTARAFVVLFALCCLVSLLFDLVPTLAHLYWNQAARIPRLIPLSIAPNTFVSMLGLGLILTLLLPQLFPQPNKVITKILLVLLPCALLFYGALCLVAAMHTNAALNVVSLPVATGGALNADTMLATLGIFRPAFGWLALLCCVPYVTPRAVPQPTKLTGKAAISLSLFALFLAFACLLGFVGVTAAPIVTSKAWLLGEQGLNPLRTAFFSSYPQDGWLIEASLAALSATTLLALSALTGAALTLLHKKAEARTLLLILLAVMLGMLSSGSKGGGEAWQTNLLFVLQHTQKIGQLAQGIATLLFLAALGALALRSLKTLRR